MFINRTAQSGVVPLVIVLTFDESNFVGNMASVLGGLVGVASPLIGAASSVVINAVVQEIERTAVGNWKDASVKLAAAIGVALWAAITTGEVPVSPPPIGGGGGGGGGKPVILSQR